MSFRIGKTRISCSFPLMGLMTAIVLIDRSLSVVVCFGAALMHEAGHLIALRFCGSTPEEIRVTLFDVAIVDREKAMRRDRQELMVTLAGVTVNFLSAGAGYLFYRLTKDDTVCVFVYAHLTLGLFNALPVDTLDGGQAVLLLLQRKMTPYRAQCLLDMISLTVLLPMAVLGFWILLRSRYNFTLLAVSLYLTATIISRKL